MCDGCSVVFDSLTRNKRQRFCSQSCAQQNIENSGRLAKGLTPWNKGIKGAKSHSFGRDFTDERRMKISLRTRGKNNGHWKGDEASYGSIHDWVRRWFGRPSLCESCSKEPPYRIEWSNKDGLYSRRREDWQQLCVKCHKIFDKGKKIIRKKF